MSVDAARAGLRLRGAHVTVYKPRTHARRTQQNESGRERERARERARERERGRVEEQEKRTGMPRTPVRVRACTHTLGVRAPPAPPARTCGARRQRLPAVPPAPAASSHQHERAPSICGIAHASHARSLPPALGASGRSPFAPRCGLQPGSAGGQQTPSCRCRCEAATASAISPRARGRRRTHQQRQPPGQEPPSFLSSQPTFHNHHSAVRGQGAFFFAGQPPKKKQAVQAGAGGLSAPRRHRRGGEKRTCAIRSAARRPCAWEGATRLAAPGSARARRRAHRTKTGVGARPGALTAVMRQ